MLCQAWRDKLLNTRRRFGPSLLAEFSQPHTVVVEHPFKSYVSLNVEEFAALQEKNDEPNAIHSVLHEGPYHLYLQLEYDLPLLDVLKEHFQWQVKSHFMLMHRVQFMLLIFLKAHLSRWFRYDTEVNQNAEAASSISEAHWCVQWHSKRVRLRGHFPRIEFASHVELTLFVSAFVRTLKEIDHYWFTSPFQCPLVLHHDCVIETTIYEPGEALELPYPSNCHDPKRWNAVNPLTPISNFVPSCVALCSVCPQQAITQKQRLQMKKEFMTGAQPEMVAIEGAEMNLLFQRLRIGCRVPETSSMAIQPLVDILRAAVKKLDEQVRKGVKLPLNEPLTKFVSHYSSPLDRMLPIED